MRQSIGEWFTYNIIIIFILIVFGLLAATLSYYKAFKVNSMILYSIDKFEGYHDKTRNEIESYLGSIGYTAEGRHDCGNRGRMVNISDSSSKYNYCVYYISNDAVNQSNKKGEPLYYNYAVVTYIYIDLPIVDKFKVPIYTKGERIYNFSDKKNQLSSKKP